MENPPPTREEWQRLYDLSVQVRELAPWQWMEEIDLFGVQNPETKEFGFVSVMGMAGEHYAVTVYLGAQGLYQFWDFQDFYPNVEPTDLMNMPQLMASFENRFDIDKQDYAKIKELAYKFRGHHAWPAFRQYAPGLAPWYIDGPQARFLAYALEQLLDVAPRYKENPALMDSIEDIEQYLVRVPRRKNNVLRWEDHIMKVQRPPAALIEVQVDHTLLDAVKKMPRQLHQIETDCFMIPAQIGEEGTRPYFAYAVLLVEPLAGMVIGVELLQPLPSLEAMWGTVPEIVLRQLARTGHRPAKLLVRSPMLAELLSLVADPAGLVVEMTSAFRVLDFVRLDLENSLRG
ncbi:MAG: hypothetical protein L0154_12760 [Chloroflexi bacterium]|nr:hypothetical protein [Chloroflexota bacterium]